MVLTTRPTLLHLLIKLSEAEAQPDSNTEDTIPQPVLTLSEACIHAARHSHSLILTKWFNGTLPVFGYFHAHYLFSSALVLAMSSFAPVGSPSDMGGFETALEVLGLMSENGNLAAGEFFQNLVQVKLCLEGYREERLRKRYGGEGVMRGSVNALAAIGPGDVSASSVTTPASSSGIEGQGQSQGQGPTTTRSVARTATTTVTADTTPNMAIGHNPNSSAYHHTTLQNNNNDPISPLHDANSGNFTTAMAFLEPTMQDFLTRSDIDLGLLNPVDTFMNDAESLYTLHGL